jgi:hypothetical protein
LIPPTLNFLGWSAATRRLSYRIFEVAEFRMAVATIGYQKGNQGSNSFDIGAIDYGTAIARAAH